MPARHRILITGARGFIGSRLSSFLSGKGYDLINYTNDINDAVAMERDCRGVDLVIHLAAKCDKMRVGREGDDYLTVNVLGTMNVINACLAHHCALIHFSSISAEQHGDMYGLSKFFSEKVVKFYAQHRGLSAIIIRPSGVYDEGNNDRQGKPMNFSKGRHYPVGHLVRDIEYVIQNHDFGGPCKTYTPKLFFDYYILYWLKRIRNKMCKHYDR